MANQYTSEWFTFYADPGHAWLKVPLKALRDCGLGSTRDFSSYSFYKHDEKGGHVYLEEDCDAGIFLAAYYGRHRAMPLIKHNQRNSDSPIRRFERLPHGDRFNINMQEGRAIWREMREQNAA